MINYRGFKKLLGETSLERKCRLLFGVALMALITTSFWIYATLTRQVMESQQVEKAESYVPVVLRRRHARVFSDKEQKTKESQSVAAETPAFTAEDWKQFEDSLGDSEDLKFGGGWDLILSTGTPRSDLGHEALLSFRNGGEPMHEFVENEEGVRELHYFRAIRGTRECIRCHNGTDAEEFAAGDLVAMAEIRLSMRGVEAELSRNNAILLGSAIITTFLAMLVAYVIVRYIIVKPVLHLKDVSDEIARGNLNLRAEINTGDEFEELSHAFNRMLRHMTTVNDELRGVNENLDRKVDQLAQANMELFNTNAMKDEFLATMSHELRTPLNSILGFSDVLSSAQNLDDRQKRYVGNIQTSGRNLMVQINDLLDLAKIESGEMTLQLGDVNVQQLIENQRSQILPLADQKNIELKSRYPEEELPILQQDIGKMRQILTNLLSNAIKFTPEGGRIRISAQMLNDETVEISVEDTGIGIPMHEQEEIFEKFRQGTTTTGDRDQMKREYGGTGLGLSIVRELSRLLGGDVFLESEFGKGSIFMVQLPIKPPPEQPPEQIESPSSPGLNRITATDLMKEQNESAASAEPATAELKVLKLEPSSDAVSARKAE